MTRVCVIGAGPAGFYAARALLRRGVDVDLLEALPVPFGLVRYGVAPDHPDTKNATHGFADLVRNSAGRLRFRGNVRVDFGPAGARDVSSQPGLALADLRQMYPLVLSATGAAHPRKLPPTMWPDTSGHERVRLAHDFVAWLNGHPYYTNKPALLPSSGGEVSIIGAGNVALDCARLLLRTPASLRATDISPGALDALDNARVAKVDVFVRRRPRDAAWTTAALREVVTKIDSVRASISNPHLVEEDLAADGVPRQVRRRLEILAKLEKGDCLPGPASDGRNVLQFNFGFSPESIRCDQDGVDIDFGQKIYEAGPSSSVSESVSQVATETRRTGLALLSLGYVGGSASDEEDLRVGWANGQGTGIIGDNMVDAESVVAKLTDEQLGLGRGQEYKFGETSAVSAWAKQASVQLVDWDGWERIDREEQRRGPQFCAGRERIKVESIEEMLKIAGEAATNV